VATFRGAGAAVGQWGTEKELGAMEAHEKTKRIVTN